MFTLVYSNEAAEEFGYNKARTTSGEVVCYTFMIDEEKYGPWDLNYHWKDAKKVGECESYRSIVSRHPVDDDPCYNLI